MKNRHGGVEIMAGAAAGAKSATARLGLPAASRCVRQHNGEHVHKKVPGYACKLVPLGSGSIRGVAMGCTRAWRSVASTAWLGWPVSVSDRACT
jgi:hypothetical protein